MNFFESWGTQENPIRQSDLQNVFGSVFGCPKNFAMSKLYPSKSDRINFRTACGDILHGMIAQDISGCPWPREKVADFVKKYPKEIHGAEEGDIEEYQTMLDLLLANPIYRNIKKRTVEVERSFMVESGGIWIAGSVDLIIKGKTEGSFVLVDWKTGKGKSQFEMDNSYQSRIYAYALEHGEFFLKPEILDSGRDYHDAWKKTHIKNSYSIRPEVIYCYLRDLLPAKRDSVRKSDHYSTKTKEGKVHIAKGEPRGPVWYSTKVPKDMRRLEYSAKVAVALSKMGMWPEYFGNHCKTCLHAARCENMGVMYTEKQTVMNLINDLGIELD